MKKGKAIVLKLRTQRKILSIFKYAKMKAMTKDEIEDRINNFKHSIFPPDVPKHIVDFAEDMKRILEFELYQEDIVFNVDKQCFCWRQNPYKIYFEGSEKEIRSIFYNLKTNFIYPLIFDSQSTTIQKNKF